MSKITFTVSIENGKIKITEKYKQKLSNGNMIQVTVFQKKKITETTLLSRFIKKPIEVRGFTPLTRGEAHERIPK